MVFRRETLICSHFSCIMGFNSAHLKKEELGFYAIFI